MKNSFTERNRTKVVFAVGIAVAFVLGQLVPLAANAQNAQQTVTIEVAKGASSPTSYSFFESDPMQVRLNTAIIWSNRDSVSHHIVSGNALTGQADGIFDTGILNPNQTSRPILFDKENTFQYFCEIHPFMIGQVKASNWALADFGQYTFGEVKRIEMNVNTSAGAYNSDDSVKIMGKVSRIVEQYASYKINPVFIRIYDSSGNKMYVTSVLPAKDLSFRANFKASMLPAGEYTANTTYINEYGSAKFKVIEKKDTILTAKADGRSSTKFTQLSIGNSKDSGDSVYKVMIDLPKNVDVTKVIAPKGWKWAKDSNSVTFSTNTAPIEPGKTRSFKLYTFTVIRTIDWTAYDSKDNQVGNGSMRVNMHR